MEYLHPAVLIDTFQNYIIGPGPASIVPLFLFSFVNDLFGVFPFAIVIASQLFFLKEAFTLALAIKLFLFVAVPVGLGATLGSVPLYFIAYYGGRPLIKKVGRFVRLSWEDVERVQHYLKGTWYDEIIFFVLRCTPVLPSIPLDVAAGVIRMDFFSFMFLTAIGSVVRMTLTLLIVGLSLHGIAGLTGF